MNSETVSTIVLGVSVGGFLYLGLLHYLNKKSFHNSEPINSKEDLEKILNEEKERQGIKSKVVVSIRNCKYSYVENIEQGLDKIILKQEHTKRMCLRHELNHIKNKDIGGKKYPVFDQLKYYFYQEPRTIIHCIKSRKEDKF